MQPLPWTPPRTAHSDPLDPAVSCSDLRWLPFSFRDTEDLPMTSGPTTSSPPPSAHTQSSPTGRPARLASLLLLPHPGGGWGGWALLFRLLGAPFPQIPRVPCPPNHRVSPLLKPLSKADPETATTLCAVDWLPCSAMCTTIWHSSLCLLRTSQTRPLLNRNETAWCLGDETGGAWLAGVPSTARWRGDPEHRRPHLCSRRRRLPAQSPGGNALPSSPGRGGLHA